MTNVISFERNLFYRVSIIASVVVISLGLFITFSQSGDLFWVFLIVFSVWILIQLIGIINRW